MTIFRHALHAQCRKALLAGLTLSALLMPTYAISAEREGTVLFFSVADLQQALSSPALPSLAALLSLPQLSPSFAWQEQPEAVEQDGPLERNTRYGNGLGIDGYRLPGTRPLWGN